jgi:hypothetical protein
LSSFQIKLSTGIARGKSCTSVLVVPRRIKSLCEALFGRAAMVGLELMEGGHGSSPERKGGERGEGGGRGRY